MTAKPAAKLRSSVAIVWKHHEPAEVGAALEAPGSNGPIAVSDVVGRGFSDSSRSCWSTRARPGFDIARRNHFVDQREARKLDRRAHDMREFRRSKSRTVKCKPRGA